MAYALGSLGLSTCAMLEEAESLLVDRSDLDMLSQVLIEHGLFTEKERNMVSICLIGCFAYN